MARNPNKQCEICGKWVYRNPNIKGHVTCSKECRSKLNKLLNGKIIKCSNCNKEFYKKNSRIKEHNFCCLDCQKEYNSPKLEIREIIKLHQEGLYDKDIAKKAKCSRELITKILNNNGYDNRHSKIDDVILRNRISKSNKGKRTGRENHNYKGKSNFTGMARGLFNSISKTYMRNHNYTCELCGKRGGNLNTHHKKKFSEILDKFLELNPNVTQECFSKEILQYKDFIDDNNLILLCEKCHKNIHYGDNHEPSLE